jgi:cell wall-associated NlpC family hydrolase
MQLDYIAHNAFQAHVLKDFPNEAVGLVISGKYFACTNTSDEPTKRFRLDVRERNELEQQHGPIQALMHSHPYTKDDSKACWRIRYNPVWPSVADQTAYLADDVPWGIASTDGQGLSEILWMSEEMLPLIQRMFAVFTSDCYTAVRDWHRTNTGIVLPNFPRGFRWWENGPNGQKGLNTIEENLLTLKNVTRHEPGKAEYGDIAVFAVYGSQNANHLGVICGNNEMYHHLPAVRSQYAVIARWDEYRPTCRYVVRLGKE